MHENMIVRHSKLDSFRVGHIHCLMFIPCYSVCSLFEVSIFEESHVSIMHAQRFATIVIVDGVLLSSKDGLFIEIEYVSSGRLDDAR